MRCRRLALVGVLLLAACKPSDQETGSINKEDVRAARAKLAGEVVMHVDSGNAAFKTKDYQRALGHYRAATRLDDDAAAPWFGIYMVQRALGNGPAADSALKRAQKVAPGATLLQPNPNTDDESP